MSAEVDYQELIDRALRSSEPPPLWVRLLGAGIYPFLLAWFAPTRWPRSAAVAGLAIGFGVGRLVGGGW